MKHDTTLIVSGLTDFSVVISADAEQKKADALDMSKSIVTVRNAQEQQDAITAGGILRGLLKGCEAMREEIKKPILAAGREIDDVAKLYSGSLKAELTRVEGLAADWQKQENARLAVIRAEQERKDAEAVAAAEAERKAFLAIIANTTDEQAREVVRKAADDAAEANAEAARLRQQAILPIGPQVTGARVTVMLDYEILDIHQLAKARPDLVTIEPKRSLLLAAINIPGASIPGIRVFETTKVAAKAL